MDKDAALDLALEALENSYDYVAEEADRVERMYGNYPTRQGKVKGLRQDERKHMEAITAIKQARSAPYVASPRVQSAERGEPVAFNAGVPPLYPEMKDGETISVEYTTPPTAQRQWTGLTDEEIAELRRLYAEVDRLSYRLAYPDNFAREWVGLTDEERMDILLNLNWDKKLSHMDTALAIEAKLKEKNT